MPPAMVKAVGRLGAERGGRSQLLLPFAYGKKKKHKVASPLSERGRTHEATFARLSPDTGQTCPAQRQHSSALREVPCPMSPAESNTRGPCPSTARDVPTSQREVSDHRRKHACPGDALKPRFSHSRCS